MHKLIFVLLSFSLFASEETLWQRFCEDFSHEGALCQEGDFLYVDLSDEVVHSLIEEIRDQGFVEPPYFGEGLVGAHITVVSGEEASAFGLGKVPQIGQLIQFKPLEYSIVNPPNLINVDQVFLIVVESRELDELREDLGLPPSRFAHHITIGFKYATEEGALERRTAPLSR